MREDKAEKKQLNIGQQLKARRQALRLSLAQVEIDTKIRGKFLTALESGDYKSLPNDIYSRGFVQHYATHLGLDGAEIAAAYVAERGGVDAADTRRPRLARPKRLVFTGQIIAVLAVVIAAGAVLSYILMQFTSLAAAPTLEITSPDADRVQVGAVLEVAGRTTPGTDVSVNDSPVLTDTDGNFSEKIALQEGVNAIRVVAKSKLGKTTTVTRNVLAKLPVIDPAQATVPPAPFDGVAVAVKTTDTTSVVVSVDGKEVWRAIVASGWSKVFTGKSVVSVTTGDAGATGVTVTNAVAANKLLSPLGQPGEIRRGQDFAKDTVIP